MVCITLHELEADRQLNTAPQRSQRSPAAPLPDTPRPKLCPRQTRQIPAPANPERRQAQRTPKRSTTLSHRDQKNDQGKDRKTRHQHSQNSHAPPRRHLRVPAARQEPNLVGISRRTPQNAVPRAAQDALLTTEERRLMLRVHSIIAALKIIVATH